MCELYIATSAWLCVSFTLLSLQNRMSALEVSESDGQADCFVYLQIALMCELQIAIGKQMAVCELQIVISK